ncbi:MAG: hypothetical protein KIH63_004685 [Candidatus Saccharibacteria bacterium]|nr:hypothetical protein [Candidatus Saccharibacteria bacterium]
MAAFELAISAVLKNEGGLVNNPADNGGITNYGISLNFYKTIKPDAVAADIKLLTRDMAVAIYRKEFWDKNKYNMIASQKIAGKVFDLAVNMGALNANKCLQRAILAASGRDVGQDGILGPNTLYAVNYAEPASLYAALKSEAAGHYRLIFQAQPQEKVFLKGWLNRAYSDV